MCFTKSSLVCWFFPWSTFSFIYCSDLQTGCPGICTLRPSDLALRQYTRCTTPWCTLQEQVKFFINMFFDSLTFTAQYIQYTIIYGCTIFHKYVILEAVEMSVLYQSKNRNCETPEIFSSTPRYNILHRCVFFKICDMNKQTNRQTDRRFLLSLESTYNPYLSIYFVCMYSFTGSNLTVYLSIIILIVSIYLAIFDEQVGLAYTISLS